MVSLPANILLVDDDPVDLLLIERSLSLIERSCQTQSVRDGVDAVSFLRQEGEFTDAPRPDLVLLDLNMPRMGGLEALEKIKRDPQLRSIPIVILTTSQEERDVVASYQRHANGYLVKSADAEPFLALLTTTCDYWFSTVERPC